MAYDELMADKFRIWLAESDAGTVQEKHMFGALGFMVDANLIACVGDRDVMYRLGAERCKELFDQEIAVPIVMGARTMKDWVNIPFKNLDNPDRFKEYITQSLEFSKHAIKTGEK
ncbi:MAG TPA: TfoX/Sxy family protein [Candidatus Saccharimonadales bacterium]|jgi:TfoX/Sxy family transcriptional regulator of competence genes